VALIIPFIHCKFGEKICHIFEIYIRGDFIYWRPRYDMLHCVYIAIALLARFVFVGFICWRL